MTFTGAATGVETEINTFIQSWLGAKRSRDADGEVDHFSSNGTGYTLAPPLSYTNGGEHQRETLKQWQTGFQGEMNFEVRDLHIVSQNDVAFCHFLVQMSATTAGGESFSFWMRTTLGLHKVDGQWKIAHLHESVPFYMDGSFLAATDLSPE